jgi:metal-dependent amidase/aminoacylase/carboxypeptidase family protein
VRNATCNGFVNKTIRYTGKASHAANQPEAGIDALNAATLALHAIDMQRESFKDRDTVRCHGFISRGGEAVNIIADNVTMEYCVRANNIPAVRDANYKVDRALRAAPWPPLRSGDLHDAGLSAHQARWTH